MNAFSIEIIVKIFKNFIKNLFLLFSPIYP